MLVIACKKFFDVTKMQIKYFLRINVLLAFAIVAVTPLIFGIRNLDSIASSFVLERFIALIGIVLFTPLFSPESDKNIQELVESKYTSPTFVSMTRLFLSAAILFILVAFSINIMQLADCEFDILKFLFGTLSSALFLGSLGFTAYSISQNIVVGYMVPIIIYMLNMFQGEKLKMLYLFSLSQNSVSQKYCLFGSAVLFFAAGLLFRYFVRRLR